MAWTTTGSILATGTSTCTASIYIEYILKMQHL
jgi:hypothetical protein